MLQLQKRVILAVALLLAAAFVLLALPPRSPRPASQAAVVSSLPAYKYRVAAYGGFVAVFVGEQPTPAYITDTQVLTLPQADRDALELGIPVYTEEELSRLLEDYGT